VKALMQQALAWGRRLPPPVKRALLPLYQALRARGLLPAALAGGAGQGGRYLSRHAVDIVISPNEISFAHGTGVLLTRLMEDTDQFVAFRSRSDYGGTQRISPRAAHVLPAGTTDRAAIFAEVQEWTRGLEVRSILCVPYFETDLTLAVATQAITGAPLGLWIMDDNCLRNDGIARTAMAEAIARADALFAISPELKATYQTEFRRPMSVVPPLVAPSLIRSAPSAPRPEGRLVMIGNVWSPELLERLSQTSAAAGLEIDWYASNPGLWNGRLSPARLKERGITVMEGDDPKTLAAAVEVARAVIVPSDSGDAGDHAGALGAMSLPTRIPFVLATAGTPIIAVSRPRTATAAFIERFGIGLVCPYEAGALAASVAAVSTPEEQARIRAEAARLGPRFSFAGAREVMFATINNGGRLADDRFDTLLPRPAGYAVHVDRQVDPAFERDFGEVLQLADRLKAAGFRPDFVVDVGASTGIWSLAVSGVFATARYVLCDPMFSRYGKLWTKPGFELVEAAIADKPGMATFSVSNDLYGSSLLHVSGVASVVDSVTVPVRTLDEIAAERGLTGRGLVKIDVQYAEHLVVDGAEALLRGHADIVILELTLARAHPQARTLLEMANRMEGLGFRIFDHTGGWRDPATGALEQLDLVFIRNDLALPGLAAG
jgi:FkbM family methyltransferase